MGLLHLGFQIGFAAFLLVAATTTASAGSTIFRCADSTGKIRFQQQPCDVGSSQKKLSEGAATGNGWRVIRSNVPTTYLERPQGTADLLLRDQDIKTVGVFRRVAFKQMLREKTGQISREEWRPEMTYYVYYRCDRKEISDAVPYLESNKDSDAFVRAFEARDVKDLGRAYHDRVGMGLVSISEYKRHQSYPLVTAASKLIFRPAPHADHDVVGLICNGAQ